MSEQHIHDTLWGKSERAPFIDSEVKRLRSNISSSALHSHGRRRLFGLRKITSSSDPVSPRIVMKTLSESILWVKKLLLRRMWYCGHSSVWNSGWSARKCRGDSEMWSYTLENIVTCDPFPQKTHTSDFKSICFTGLFCWSRHILYSSLRL